MRKQKILGSAIALLLAVAVTSLPAVQLPVIHASASAGYYPFFHAKGDSDPRWGYIDGTGKEVIAPVFQSVEPFDERGLAVVSVKDDEDYSFGLIDRTGQFVVKPTYDSIRRYGKSLYIGQQGKMLVLLDLQGKVVKSFTDSYLHEASDGLAVFSQNDRYGYLDEAGNIVIQPQYKYAEAFSQGVATVVLANGQYALINNKGRLVQELPYTDEQISLDGFHDGLAVFYDRQTSLYGYLDQQGKLAIPVKYRDAQPFQQGLAVVNANPDGYPEQLGLLSPKGEFVVAPEYAKITYLQNGLWAVGKGDEKLDIPPAYSAKYALVNQQGQFLTEFVFDNIEPFNGNLAVVQVGFTTYFIDQTGKKADNLPTFAGVGTATLQGDVIQATIDQRLQYVKRDGTVIWKTEEREELAPGVFVREAKLRPHRNYLAYYPVIEGLSDKQVEQKLNALLKHKVGDAQDFSIVDSGYDFSIAGYKKDLLVIHESGYVYPFGAAHGMPSSEYLHLDLKSGQQYQLKDLFRPGSDYKQRINELLLSQMRTDAEELGIFPDTADNFAGIGDEQKFYIEGETLNIYFYPYEVGPYAAGFITFAIPFAKLQDIIEEKGAFWQSFHE